MLERNLFNLCFNIKIWHRAVLSCFCLMFIFTDLMSLWLRACNFLACFSFKRFCFVGLAHTHICNICHFCFILKYEMWRSMYAFAIEGGSTCFETQSRFFPSFFLHFSKNEMFSLVLYLHFVKPLFLDYKLIYSPTLVNKANIEAMGHYFCIVMLSLRFGFDWKMTHLWCPWVATYAQASAKFVGKNCFLSHHLQSLYLSVYYRLLSSCII